MSTDSPAAEPAAAPKWQSLESNQRRVLGVLVEKAKTTPETYPLSLNALRSGCNQKNNRSPLMQLEESQVEEALDELRKVGAVSVVQGEGRIDRYRHRAYEWLGVDKVELAVMAELLMRGSQTVGELRGRAARMEPIKGLSELEPTLESLTAKGLVQYLTPPGRGSIITHTLYLDREMEKVRREAGAHASVATGGPPVAHDSDADDEPAPRSLPAAQSPRPQQAPAARVPAPQNDSLQSDVESLRQQVAALKQELNTVRNELTSTTDELRRDLDALNRQLGN